MRATRVISICVTTNQASGKRFFFADGKSISRATYDTLTDAATRTDTFFNSSKYGKRRAYKTIYAPAAIAKACGI